MARKRHDSPITLPDLPPIPAPERKDAEVGFTTTTERRERIKAAARVRGWPLAKFAREACEAEAERVLEEWRQAQAALSGQRGSQTTGRAA